jgi:hypothetical protein
LTASLSGIMPRPQHRDDLTVMMVIVTDEIGFAP